VTTKSTIAALCLLLLTASTAQAGTSKAECKALVKQVRDLSEQIELPEDLKGRPMLAAVEKWINAQDAATIQRMTVRIEEVTAGVQQCEASGFGTHVRTVKEFSTRLETSVLPWLRNAATADSCQELIAEAKQSVDVADTVAKLEQSIRECGDAMWLREARYMLAGIHFQQGEIARAYEQIGEALKLTEDQSDEDRAVYRALLAKNSIMTGRALMEKHAYDKARTNWQGYIDVFGTPSFDVMFDVRDVAEGQSALRELRDARYQLALACVETGDVDCVTESVAAEMEEGLQDDLRPLRELTTRTLELAAETPDATRLYDLGFDLLTTWREMDPDSYQVTRLLDDSLLGREREDRLAILRSTDDCWIPMHIAEALKQADQDYIAEVEVAAACGGESEEARRLMAEFYFDAAKDSLDRLGLRTRAADKRALLDDIEKKLIPKLAPDEAEIIRARVAEARAKMRQAAASAERDRLDRLAGCTELLAIVQWNIARENDYEVELAEFKRSCCSFLTANTADWVNWMSSRLEAEEVENKKERLRAYCK
jgi:hypothetical protein